LDNWFAILLRTVAPPDRWGEGLETKKIRTFELQRLRMSLRKWPLVSFVKIKKLLPGESQSFHFVNTFGTRRNRAVSRTEWKDQR
jgi:hypothetical protein